MEKAASGKLMTGLRTYRVGGHLFAVDTPTGLLSEKELAPYAPFQTKSYMGENPLFTITLSTDSTAFPAIGEKIADLEDENGRMALSSLPDGGMAVRLSSPAGNECCRICISPYFSNARACISGTPGERRYALDTILMLLYTFASATHNTLLMHASAVECDGKAYLFLGKSGTGKSTHARLWTEQISGATLLNDDNPVVRIIDGNAYVFGSPWSGKTPYHIARSLPLGGIVRLRQAPLNRITSLSGIKAYAALLPSCSCMRWDHSMAEAVHRTISCIIASVSVFSLECLPDREAARLCHEGVAAGLPAPEDKLV